LVVSKQHQHPRSNIMSKFVLTAADGSTKSYSRKIDATRAAEKVEGGARVVSPKGEVVMDTIPAPTPAPAAAKPKAAPKATKPAREARTWLVSGPDATHKCAGACGEVKSLKSYPTTKTAGHRGVECRKCRDTRVAV
jgi:hypothetical protein